MTKEEIQMTSFKVISHAGEAFNFFVEAQKNLTNFEFDKAEELLKMGDKELVSAHQAQTDLLHAEINNDDIPFSIILIHSQDHLMHAMTYQQVVKDNIVLYKKLQKVINS